MGNPFDASSGLPPGPELDVFGSICLQLGDQLKGMRGDMRRTRQQAIDARGIDHSCRAAGIVPASGTLVLDLGDPAVGREWAIRQLKFSDANLLAPSTPGTATSASGSFAAAAAGSASLPAGASIAGFTVTMAPEATAVSGTVTVTGVTGGTQSYTITDGPAGGLLTVTFPAPLPPTSSATQITVNVPAITGGGAGSIVITGITAATGGVTGQATFYVGSPSSYSPTNWAWTLASLPGIQNFTSDVVKVIPRDRLFCVLTGGTPGEAVLAQAQIVDFPANTAIPTVDY